MPKRHQLRRTRGFRLPDNTVSVARPTKWGNPFAIGNHCEGMKIETREQAVACFRVMLAMDRRNYPSNADIRRDLAGKNLACWCPPGEPCHADVLLDIANDGKGLEYDATE